MWNLSGNDIERAKDELAGRRAAIQAAYDNGMKQVEKELADLDAFERAAVDMLSHLKGGEAAATAAEPAPAAPAVAAVAEPESMPSAEPASAHDAEPAEHAAEADAAADAHPVERGSSRWRMRLADGGAR